MSDIAARLKRIIGAHGPQSVGWYMGNPGAFSYSHTLWVKGFLDGLGSAHYYSAGSQDVNNRFAASALLYGSPLLVPIPDLNRTDFLLHGRRQPARLARLGAVGAACARAAERGRRPWRARGRRRPAPLGDGAPLRARRDPSRRRRLAAPLDAARDLRRGPRGPRRDRARRARSGGAGRAGAAFRPRAHRVCHRRARRDGPRGGARVRDGAERRRATGAPAPAWAASGRWSPTCSTRSTRSPATSTGPAARSSAARPSRSTRSPRKPASRRTARSTRASAGSRT